MDSTDFYSADRLVEFGMGTAIATQMAQSMNQAIAQMQVPGSSAALPAVASSVYYAAIDGKAAGPYSLSGIARLIAEKKVLKETYIWKPGMADWMLAENVSELVGLIAIEPPALPQTPQF